MSLSSSPLTVPYLTQVLKDRLEAHHVEVTDQSGGCGAAFHAVIVSPLFLGQSVLNRHRLVNKAIEHEISRMHAFSQKTYTPEQYQSIQLGGG